MNANIALTSSYTLLLNHIVKLYEPVHEISNNVVYATSKDSDQPVHMRSLISAFASRFQECFAIVNLLTDHHLKFLSFKGDCTDSSESTLVKMSNLVPRLNN